MTSSKIKIQGGRQRRSRAVSNQVGVNGLNWLSFILADFEIVKCESVLPPPPLPNLPLPTYTLLQSAGLYLYKEGKETLPEISIDIKEEIEENEVTPWSRIVYLISLDARLSDLQWILLYIRFLCLVHWCCCAMLCFALIVSPCLHLHLFVDCEYNIMIRRVAEKLGMTRSRKIKSKFPAGWSACLYI